MSRAKTISLATAAAVSAIISNAANAADLPPPVVVQPVVEFGGWYLRGDIGMSNQEVKNLDNALFATAPGLTWLDKGSFDSAPILGLGFGYKFNDWFRMDATGEYRGKSTFRALDSYGGAVPGTNDYIVTKSEWLALVNAYLDLGTWWCITPFVGAGVGAANVKLSGFRDVNVPNNGVAYAADDSKWNFAWALHAGLAYQVTPGFTVEFSYRYLNMGDGQTGDIIAYDGTNAVYNPMIFKDITSHDLRLGLRWDLNQGNVAAVKSVGYMPPPAYGKGPVAVPQTYAPPPAPTYLPPLRTRG
jgi:opacity protein-like surface antigen